ncbi:GNAT family N-acetyltransferase [bacterium]|nr:GNAT family N-acetyltransferase [bacterium]
MNRFWIRTDRLVLRPWEESDASRLVLMTQEHNFRSLWGAFKEPMDLARALHWVQRMSKSQTKGREISWAIVESNHVVGVASLVPRQPDLEDHTLMAVEYRLLHSAQGRGLATEAMLGIMEFGQRELGIEEFHAFVTPENTQAKNVAFKLGMRYWRMGRIDGVVVEIYRIHTHPGEPLSRRNRAEEVA